MLFEEALCFYDKKILRTLQKFLLIAQVSPLLLILKCTSTFGGWLFNDFEPRGSHPYYCKQKDHQSLLIDAL
jgi:hypothetical protein